MKRFFAAVCALACVIATSAALAAPNGHRAGRGARIGIGPGVDATQGMRTPNMQDRIPAPLPAPPQPPVIHGPLSPNGLPPMGLSR